MTLFQAPKEALRPAEQRVGCEACSLSTQWPRLKNPRILPDPNFLAEAAGPVVYFLGGAPNGGDDEVGAPFKGDSTLRNALRRFELPFTLSNVCRCKPPTGEKPKPSEIAACWGGHAAPDLKQTQPLVIVPLGNIALNRFLPGTVQDWERVRVPVLVEGTPTWVLPLQDTETLVERDNDDEMTLWRRALDDLYQDIGTLARPAIVSYEEALAGIEIILPGDLLTGRAIEGRTLGVDLETTTLMPWEPGGKILSASVSNGPRTVAWLVEHPDNPNPQLALDVLLATLRAATRLIAHNGVFEIRWLAKYYGMEVFSWNWCDTMARPFAELGVIQGNAHRSQDEGYGRLAGLGKQTQLHFGFNVKDVLNVDPVKWRNYTVEQFLLYNGLDAKWCWKLWHQPLSPWARVEVERQRGAVRAMGAISWRGMLVDQNELAAQSEKLEASVKTETAAIVAHIDVVRWESQTRTKFNPGSPDQVAQFFDLPTADEDALAEVESDLAKKILRLRKLDKLLGTYAKGIYKALYPDGYLHPDYSCMRVVTGRTSTQKPNAQNMPVRTNKEFRKVIVPPQGCALVSLDYKQLEARGVTIATKDPTMLGYVWRDDDIHREWAVELLDEYPEIADRLCPHVTDDKKVIARVRGEMKNGFTFPLIYGAALKRCAGELQVPEDVLGPIVERFWKKYAGIRTWQDVVHAFYRQHLYVETMTQRRRFGPVSWTEQLNTPIQGTGSDIVTDAADRCVIHAVETGDVHFIPMVDLHDDLSFYLPTPRMQGYIETIAKIMVTPTYGFITVPLAVEVKVGIHNWSEQHEFGTYTTADFFPLPKNDLTKQVAAIQALGRAHGRSSGGVVARPVTRPVIAQRPAPIARTPLNAARRERIAVRTRTPTA